ncbi:hypothetical protein GP486_002234 [Trichoglossum hirsutum]|uniref:EB1 C-terminal domain-containing protein n=1 Tax=Trichoglossum hirsutum TaxID=265104 RepID=A0A9P8LF57_9PEZI|nr:hypothetical protein GP486_002234 [Trichoglossum hirsutum]
MAKVKFNVSTEYAYLQNFKILQSRLYLSALRRGPAMHARSEHDNLEFLQWSKRYWDQYYPGGEYDALARRKASGTPLTTAPAPSTTRASGGAAKRGTTPTAAGARTRTPLGGASTSALQQENATLKENVAGLERERDFYFSKLRDIELLLQQAVELNPEIENDEDGLVKHIQGILYSTEVSADP